MIPESLTLSAAADRRDASELVGSTKNIDVFPSSEKIKSKLTTRSCEWTKALCPSLKDLFSWTKGRWNFWDMPKLMMDDVEYGALSSSDYGLYSNFVCRRMPLAVEMAAVSVD